jgi:hypothetical protein
MKKLPTEKNKTLLIIIVAIFLSNIFTAVFWNTYYVQIPWVISFRPLIVPRKVQTPLKKAPTSKVEPTNTLVSDKVTVDVISQQTDMSDKEIAAYIKGKSWDYSIAIRLAKSENFWNLTQSFNCLRTHTNTNGSIDVGIFQINSIHTSNLAKLGMTMEDMKDCKKNIDYAYGMWKAQGGFQAWSAFVNGSYKNHSEI